MRGPSPNDLGGPFQSYVQKSSCMGVETLPVPRDTWKLTLSAGIGTGARTGSICECWQMSHIDGCLRGSSFLGVLTEGREVGNSKVVGEVKRGCSAGCLRIGQAVVCFSRRLADS